MRIGCRWQAYCKLRECGRLAELGSGNSGRSRTQRVKVDCCKGGLAKRSGRSRWKYRARSNLAGKDKRWFVAVVKDCDLKFDDDVVFAGTKGPLARHSSYRTTAGRQHGKRRVGERVGERVGCWQCKGSYSRHARQGRARQGMWILVLVRLTHLQEPRQGHFSLKERVRDAARNT